MRWKEMEKIFQNRIGKQNRIGRNKDWKLISLTSNCKKNFGSCMALIC